MDYKQNLYRARHSILDGISKTSDVWIDTRECRRYYLNVTREVEIDAEKEFLQSVAKLLWLNYDYDIALIKRYNFNIFTKINAETIEDEIVDTCCELFKLLNLIDLSAPLQRFLRIIDSILYTFNNLCSLREIRRQKINNLKKIMNE